MNKKIESRELDANIVCQRVRNRIIEMLVWVLESECEAPAQGFNELINSWYDWNEEGPDVQEFTFPTYTAQEAGCLCQVGAAMDTLCRATPATITDDQAVLRMPEWLQVVEAARKAHAECMRRGFLPEDDMCPK